MDSLLIVIVVMLLAELVISFQNEDFREKMDVKYLGDGRRVYVSWEFNITLHETRSDIQHFKLLPKALIQIIEKNNVNEMQLSFSSGQWDYLRWGEPFHMSPTGAELWAWMEDSGSTTDQVGKTSLHMDKQNKELQWLKLTQGLSGLFCSSLMGLTFSKTSSPSLSFSPKNNSTNQWIRHGILSREASCTENLSPWSKMLPCSRKAGLATLLEPQSIYSGDWHMQSSHIIRQCLDTECNLYSIQFKQMFGAVLRLADYSNFKPFSIHSMLGVETAKLTKCPLATLSEIVVHVPSYAGSLQSIDEREQLTTIAFERFSIFSNTEYEVVKVSTYPLETEMDLPKFVRFKLDRHVLTNLSFHFQEADHHNFTSSGMNGLLESSTNTLVSSLIGKNQYPSSIYIDRFLTGYGLVNGGISIHLVNTEKDKAIRIRYLDTIPHFLRVYFHTLRVALNGIEITKTTDLFDNFIIVPGEYKESASILEFELTLPPSTILTLSIKFEKIFMTLEEHPPDPARGLDIPSAIVTYSKHGNEIRVYSKGLLVNMPTPDFSMPFNVITISSTLMAFFGGTMFNILTGNSRKRKASKLKLAEGMKGKSE